MAKRRVTVTLAEATLRALDRQRARTGESRSVAINRALASELAGYALDRQWASAPSTTDEEAMDLAISELRAVRAERRAEHESRAGS